ncbi:2'-5' RNA ligase family protein [Streptomyces diastaticus]|uniref:2'-5' RNA ligase family protein n=1 Tax=Streptomyces TaxID=1883 RepID=UPI0018AC8E87|nr:2'-5' RNA ligase family protein [Streptomyces sp. BRB081]MBL3807305.1 2'-5' RNA ligase family protein [Streptomyces sp. BRB081]
MTEQLSARQDGPAEEDGWGDRAGDTALTIPLPALDPLVTTGIRAHATVLYPFLPLVRVRPGSADPGDADTALRALFASHAPFTLRFAAFREEPGVLFLAPEPPGPLAALTDAVRARWPEAVPYRGIFGPEGLDPHVTVAHGEEFGAVRARLAPALPVACHVTGVRLIVHDGHTWRDRLTYRLGGPARLR